MVKFCLCQVGLLFWGHEENYSNQATEYQWSVTIANHRDHRMLSPGTCFFHKEIISPTYCCLDGKTFLWGLWGGFHSDFFLLLRHVVALNLNLHLSSPQAIPTTFGAFTFHKTSLEDDRFLKGFPVCLGIQPSALLEGLSVFMLGGGRVGGLNTSNGKVSCTVFKAHTW